MTATTVELGRAPDAATTATRASRTASDAAPTVAGPDGARAAPAGGAPALELPVLGVVPAPGPESAVVPLAAVAGGLRADRAEWGVDGGQVVLTGAAPFVEVTGRAGFRSDGTLDGTVAMRASVRLLGTEVAGAEWAVSGWAPTDALATPAVRLEGATLALDLTALEGVGGVGAEVGVQPAPGFALERAPGAARVSLPPGALPPGVPIEPRVADVLRTLRGWDVSALRVHTDAPVEQAPAFVTNTELFFAPGRYGIDAPETVAILDAAVRAALAGVVGAVLPTPPAPPPQPGPDAVVPPPVDVTPVPATVPDVPAVVPPEAETPEGSGAPADGAPEGTAPAEGASAGDAEAEAAAEGEGGAPAEEAAPEGEGGAPAEEAAPDVELIMPPAPTEPGPAAQARAGGVAAGAGGAARAARDLPTADETVADARGAVTEPASETAARAQEALAEALGTRPGPSPEIVELCQRIRDAIREKRPVDEDDLLESDPTTEAQEAGATVSGSVDTQVQQVEEGYSDLENPPAGAPALTPQDPTVPPATSPGMGVDAATAAPDPIPSENLSLDADVAATDERIASSGIDTRVTQEIPEAPFSTVRDSRGELGEMAQQTPAELAAQQEAAIASAQADMAALQDRATQALLRARGQTVGAVAEGQGGATTTEEATRESVGRRSQEIFNAARDDVQALLEPLNRNAMARWTTGLARVSQEFHDSLDAVQRWIDERHSGVGGFVVGLGDAVFGLPGWVIREYDRAERAFGDGVCDLLLEISTEVNGVVAAAQAIIAQTRIDIDTELTKMEAEFPEWVAQERAKFSGMLDGLSARATAAQTTFVRDVATAATTAVSEAQAAVEERRQAALGVVGRIAAAIEAFIDDPVTAIINGLLNLVGIPPAAFWGLVAKIQQVISDIADDPENFINNLTAGVRQGFDQFFANFGTHLLRGFWDWLFSGLEVPIPLPADFSPKSLFSFALQLMGITWPRVREILVRHIGAENVELIEAAWQLVSALIEQGPDGIIEMVKEQLTPEVIVQTILEAAVEYVVQTLVEQVAARVLMLFNPVGAIAQAIELIYQVCAWIFRNAARIFRFVEAVVNGMADVIAGNIGGLANAVERALASLIPPVIDFLAGLLHMGDLPEKVAEVIVALQARVYVVMDRVVGFLAERGRAALRALGLGGEEEPGAEGANDDEELGTTVRFAAAGEGHRIWVQTAGDEATIMVASVPESIAGKIATWRAKIPDLPADKQGEATGKLNELETYANATDDEADRLAREFLQAAADQDDAIEPPSDNALENRERAMAGMLRAVFEIMESKDPEEYVADIAAHLPRHGARYSGVVRDQWLSKIRSVRRAPAGGAGGEQLWPDTVLAGTANAGMDLLAADATHRQLLPYFLVGSQSNPREASAGAFYAHAFQNESPDPPHTVRARFVDALGQAAAQALKDSAARVVTPEDNERLRTAVSQIAFTMSGRWGEFAPWPADEVNPMVKDAVRGAGGVLEFLKAMVRAQSAGGITWAQFTSVWDSSPASRSWVKNEFRAISPRSHEWIPTSEMRAVVDHAIQQAALHPTDLSRSIGWISFFSNLRSGTEDVAFQIRTSPVVEDTEEADDTIPTPLSQAGVGVHSGGQTADPAGRRTRGTIGQGPFHDWLRQVFAQQKDNGPVAFGQSLISRLGYELWDGTLTESMAPRVTWFQPIDLWFVVEVTGSGAAVRVQGLTLAQLAIRQQQAWQRIQSDFTRALYSVDAG